MNNIQTKLIQEIKDRTQQYEDGLITFGELWGFLQDSLNDPEVVKVVEHENEEDPE